MKKKLISAMLAITILSSYIPVVPITTVSEAAVTTSWEYGFTGGGQNFTVPYKGIYKIELYGAQGGNYGSYVGGKGGKVSANIEIAKGSKLTITVGGQNGYNGGGSGTYSSGGGATDIKLNGTALTDRILVAGGGGGAAPNGNGKVGGTTTPGTTTLGTGQNASPGTGGGGGYYGGVKGSPIYHTHTGTSGKVGGCYKNLTGSRPKYCGCDSYAFTDSLPGYEGISSCANCSHNHGGDECDAVVGSETYSYIGIGCGKTAGVTIDSYTSGTGGSNYITTSALYNTTVSQEGVREGNGYVKITLVESYPEVSLSASKANTNKDVTITATAKDDVIGLTSAPYSWNGAARIASNTYSATKNGTYNVNVINNYGRTETASIKINNIDKIKPVVNSITQSVASDKRTSTLTLTATDSASSDYIATGVVGYAITMTKTLPTEFQSSNTFTVNKNGTYYGWAKDAVGNISELSTSTNANILVKALEIDVEGNISWNDQSNKYASRVASKVHLYRKVGENGTESLVESKNITAGQTSYSFVTRECDDNGNRYIFRIAQDYVPGYETLYTGNSVTSNNTQTVNIPITNNLILPTYTSKIEYNLVDGFRDEYLKNTKLEIVATVEASSTNRDKTGLNQSKVTYLIDDGFTIDKNNIEVIYKDGVTGKETKIDDYILQKNNLTINYGVGTNYITKPGDKLTIKIQGVFSQIKLYNNSITLTGNLTDYKGTNTTINLGDVTKTEKNYEVKYQRPKANLRITKRDSITEGLLTDATFTLYEWDGSKYVEKEILIDDNKDGIYESAYYEWNGTTEGKYKVIETGVPVNHKDLDFSMEFVIDQLKADNYTVAPDYSNGNYRIAYGVRNPDDFDKQDGIVENEPFKLKVSIDNRDSETKNQIVSNAVYTIYEWDKANNKYVEYVSKINNQKVTIARGEDKIYVSSQWLYYTANNEGKYKVIETTAASGYYGDYVNGEKREYTFNIVDIVNCGTYEGQTVANEGTIILKNNDTNWVENKRVDTKLNISLIDDENKTNKPQSSGSFDGVKYGIYAREQINHADGVTTRYTGEAGILYKKDELIKEVTTNAEGKIVVEDLECGKYYVKQLTEPVGYLKDTKTHEVDLSYLGQTKALVEVSQTYENTAKKQSIQILKQQKTTTDEVISLEHAGFTIYEIKELSIVKEGKISKNADGTYTLKDNSAKGDERITNKANSNGTFNIEDLVNYYYKIHYTEDNMKVLPQSQHAYHPYNLSGEKLVTNYANSEQGSAMGEMITGSDGYLKTPELAYGEYILIETSVPHNKEAAKPVLVKITTDSRSAQSLRYILDPNFEAKVKIYTKDMETGKTILKEDVAFTITNKSTGNLVTYKGWNLLEGSIEYGTNENPYETTRKGYIVTPIKLAVGNYEINQIKAPEGYVLNGYEGYSENGEIKQNASPKVSFEIATNQMYYVDTLLEDNIIVTVQENKAQVGTLKVIVEGEKLVSVDKKQTPYTLTYENQKLQGVTIGLYAKENIYAQDNQETKLYSKDQLVAEKTTDVNGVINYDNIPIGNYYIKEISTIEGYALNKETKDISITYGINEIDIQQGNVGTDSISAQETPVTKHETQTEDIRQKISITITNKDTDTNEAIQGTTIGLYAKENIINKDGKVVVNKDELIEEQTTNEEGTIKITSDLPLGNYYIKQTKTATGYIQNNEVVQIDANYKEDAREVVEIQKEMKNSQTNIYVKAIDEESNIIEGSKLQLVDEDGNIVQEWTSTKEQKRLSKLEVGKRYKVKQTQALEGYATIDEIEIVVKIDGDLEKQISDEHNTIKLVHYTTKLNIQLQDKETKEELEGIKFQIIKKAETHKEDYNEGEIILEEFETTIEGHKIEKLPIGKYIITQVEGQEEKLQNKGYVRLQDVEFEVQDTKEEQKVTLEQDYTKIEIEVIDQDTKEKLQDIKFEMYNVGAPFAGNTSETDTTVPETERINEKILEFITTDVNYAKAKIPVGEYILKQITGQKESLYDKGYVTNEDIVIKVEDTGEVQKVTVEQKESILEIEVQDKVTKEEVEGTRVEIINKATKEVVAEYTTKRGQNILINQLALGEYILHYKEVDYTQGYIKGEDHTITLKDIIEKQKTVLQQDHTKIQVQLQDKETKEAVIGGNLVIVDKEGKEVTDTWITNGKGQEIIKLPIGEYYLVEKAAPTLKGYVRTEKVAFKVEETSEIQEVIMLQEYTTVEIVLKDEETKENIYDVELQIKDKNGNIVANITLKEDEKNIIERLPVGEYIIESTKMPYGYKDIQTSLKVTDKGGIQGDLGIKLEREEFDLKVEAWVVAITRNGKTEYENKKLEEKVKKVDIKDSKIKTEEIQISYKIKVSNSAKVTGQVGKVEVSIPTGMEFIASKNKTYWKEENGKVVTEGLKGRDLKEGSQAEMEITLKWKNGLEKFGSKALEVSILETQSDIGFKETNKENNKTKTADVIIGVSTGQMNLVYICWVLLILLIAVEIIISRKTKIKKFGIKDKTIKYKK